MTGLSQHFTAPSAVAAFGAFAMVALLAITFFRWSTAAAELGIEHAKQLDDRSSMRNAVMYLPFLLVSAIVILAAALGTAVDEPDHHLPTGSVIGLVGGIVAYYAASGLFSRRLGDSWRSMVRWLAPGLILPLVILLPPALVLPAWAATLVAAAIEFAIFLANKLTRR